MLYIQPLIPMKNNSFTPQDSFTKKVKTLLDES